MTTRPGIPTRRPTSPWLRCYSPQPYARLRLVCLPHAGGTASFYRDWPRHLPDHIELYAVQYPGREERYADPCVTDLDRLATLVADSLGPLLDRPLALFGHSMGAMVGHEVAVRLQCRGAVPAHLYVSAAPAPSHHEPGTIHRSSEEDLVEELRRLDGTESDALADPEVRAMVLPAVRADYRAVETFRPAPAPALACPITAYAGADDPTTSLAEIRAWAAYTARSFDLRAFPGHHFYLAGNERDLVADVVRRAATDDLP